MSATIESAIRTEQNRIYQIPPPNQSPLGEARESYSIYYESNRDDSPPESRYSLASRLEPIFSQLPDSSFVLDIGAGRGIFEAEHADRLTKGGRIKIITADIADLSPEQLLYAKNTDLAHIQGSGTKLPFKDNTFSSGFSNLAIDFMPKEALEEFHRVLKPGSQASINLHHPDTITPPGLHERLFAVQKRINQARRYGKSPKQEDLLSYVALRFKLYLKDHNILYASKDEISSSFGEAGFIIEDIKLGKSTHDKWWEVDLTNSTKLPSSQGASLMKKLHADLPDIPEGETIATFGLNIDDRTQLGKQYANEFNQRRIQVKHVKNPSPRLPSTDLASSAVIGSSPMSGLDHLLQEVVRIAKPESPIHLVVNTTDDSGESEYYYPELDEVLERYDQIYVRGTTKRSNGKGTWWEVDASIYPDQTVPQASHLPDNQFRTGPAWYLYDGNTGEKIDEADLF